MATRTWTGAAADIAQTSTVTFALTWAADDKVTVTINGKDWEVTMGTGVVSAATAATTFKEAWNGETATYAYTVNFDVADAGEFAELTATVSAEVVTLTGVTEGKPVTLSQGDIDIGTTAGNGTATLDAELIAATGKNHWNKADNWSGDTVPVDDDDIVYEASSISCLYNIDTGIDPASITIRQSYTGLIGLRPVNSDNSQLSYSEYRDQYLKFTNVAGANRVLDIGVGEGSGSSRLKIDVNDLAGIVTTVHNAGRPELTGVPAVLLRGGVATAKWNVEKGTVGIGYYEGDTSAIQRLNVSFVDNQVSDSTVWIGNDVGVTNATVIEQNGGHITYNTSDTDAISAWTQHAGEADVIGSGVIGIMTVGGTINDYMTSTITTLNVRSTGKYDANRTHEAKTVTNCNVYGSGSISDQSQRITWTSGIVFQQTGLGDATLDLGVDFTLTPS